MAKLLSKDEARRIPANIAARAIEVAAALAIKAKSSEAQNNNERATSALRFGASGTACSRAWLELYRRSFGCGGPHAHGSSNGLVSAVQTEGD